MADSKETQEKMWEILQKYKAMSLEELDRHIEETLNTPFGKFLLKINKETEDALREIEKL